jgi:predicted amidophosphoribosyltransferase
MNCPNCGHKTDRLTDQLRWCPRCGTLTDGDGFATPFLVERCRQLSAAVFALGARDPIRALWQRLGIPESINPPPKETP